MAGIDVSYGGWIDNVTENVYLSDGNNCSCTQNNCIVLGVNAATDSGLGDGQVSIGASSNPVIVTTSASAGTTSTVPTVVDAYLTILINGVRYKLALYNE